MMFTEHHFFSIEINGFAVHRDKQGGYGFATGKIIALPTGSQSIMLSHWLR